MKYKFNGKDYWRSLNQLAETDEFREFLHREFPDGASELNDTMTRRNFLSLMGASMALAGLVSCRKPVEKIVPYVRRPEHVAPGIPEQYATTMPMQNSAYGLLVESREGRPTKIEGNEQHPSSLGKSNPFTQGAILGLYDPDRSKQVRHDGNPSSYTELVTFWRKAYTKYLRRGGEGLAVISGAFSSPTLARLRSEFLNTFPQAQWAVYEPVSDENVFAGIEIATGDRYQPVYHFDEADVVLTLDADFVLQERENILHAKEFADARRVESAGDTMNRLYAVESSFTLTGGMADHRLRVQRRQIGVFTLALANALRSQGLDLPALEGSAKESYRFDMKWVRELAQDLLSNRGTGLIMAGENQPPEVHALVYALNSALGNIGNTITFRDPDDSVTPDMESFRSLVKKMNDGSVETLFILGGNPAYNAPADLQFTRALEQVPNAIHFSDALDETSRQCQWHVPESHFLESWGDARAVNGTRSVIQPLIAPLYESRSPAEIFHLIARGEDSDGYEITRETWRDILGESTFQDDWRRVLHDGVLQDDVSEPRSPVPDQQAIRRALSNYSPPTTSAGPSNLEVVFQTSHSVFDGRFANNGWLQELPDPVTKLSWDNAAVMNHKTAKELGVRNEQVIQVRHQGHQLELPVWIVPGIADFTIVLELGYGRETAGRVAKDTGFNVYKLRTSESMWFGEGATVSPTGVTYELANTQDHWSLEDRPIYREATLREYQEHPEFATEMVEHPPLENLWDEHEYDESPQWGMAIDLNVCTGCNACTIACQSENNIPIVGREQVRKGREMHWIRMDRYFSGDIEDPEMVVQPVTCMHCENAPCETVCPVNATLHDDEGLNLQVYNRCIGTRYCSNNCPYKVRRFNFFNYTKDTPEVEKMGKNPDVTVRSRGVMEKCTYCIQRIQRTQILAKNENRDLRTDEVVTACQQTCPTDAIVFGDITDPDSRVRQVKQQNRDYAMLAQLNTQPRTTYQAKLRNPNPALEDYELTYEGVDNNGEH